MPPKMNDSKPPTATTTRTLVEARTSGFSTVNVTETTPAIMMMIHGTGPHADIGNGRSWVGNNNRFTENGHDKRPSVAHEDLDFRNRKVAEETRSRFREMLTHEGHVVYQVHTNGASHIVGFDKYGPTDQYARFVFGKGYDTGRIDVNAGCLVRQIRDGQANPDWIVATDVLSAKMCAKDAASCKHLEAERTARVERQRAKSAAIEAKGDANSQSVIIAKAVAQALADHLGKK